jgi:hypothetical protein
VIAVVTTKGFDVVLVVHVLLAVASLVALLVLRGAALAVERGGELPPAAAKSFSGRREVAARVIHLVPLSGIALLVLSRGAFGLSTGFVAIGLALWLVAATALEAVGLPAQHAVAMALKSAADPVPPAHRLLRATEFAALALVIAALVMLAGTF